MISAHLKHAKPKTDQQQPRINHNNCTTHTNKKICKKESPNLTPMNHDQQTTTTNNQQQSTNNHQTPTKHQQQQQQPTQCHHITPHHLQT